ncbi:hypothetical protein N7539_005564 [Penicillium diatomitis]|uniref:L-asparaginase II n=1 Tax=Penicillium diatomitis TaxID=2819901 RepID=A0A9W9X7J5_9EURO|nr:uncharacterized protein N7539_005564 [Penicillium diatomitis]KAJ5485576.1 hypothetical protein N7539_005564 [Penicillium diatomitis]
MLTHLTTDYVVTDRAGVIENRHAVHAAIVDANGQALYAVGDPSRITLARSAAKPAQAAAILESGAFEKFDLDDADLALMCASHSSEERHVLQARRILSKIQCSETDLQCGGHPSISDSVNRAWIKADFTPSAIYSNCSGKHAGMLAATKALGADIQSYHSPTSPIQERIKDMVDELCQLPRGSSLWGIDGCNLPAPAFPLHRLAHMYAAFAEAAGQVEASASALDSRTRALSRVFNAMSSYPEFVGGEDRYCTVLMRAFPGILIGKLGADGCYGIGLKSSSLASESSGPSAVGIAVKIEDGNIPMLYAAVTEILFRLEVGHLEMREQLARFHRPLIKNTVGVVTGETTHMFKLRKIGEEDVAWSR